MRFTEKLFSGHRASRGGVFVGRSASFDDLMTFDRSMQGTMDAKGNAMGKKLAFPCTGPNGQTVDSTGGFLVGELERLDMTEHPPLAAVTWGRDIDLREDATIADEVTSYTNSTFTSPGGLGTGASIGTGKAWMGKTTTEIAGVAVDISKTVHPLRPWSLELKYDILELESAARLGRPIDVQKYQNIMLKHQMDIDEQVYIGDTSTGDTGLINTTAVTATNVVAGSSGYTTWAQKAPPEILADVNAALTAVWATAGWAVMPNRILIPPAQFGYIATETVSAAGNISILRYLLENNLIAKQGRGGDALEIYPLKWAIGAGAGGTIGTVGHDRMIVYTKNKDYVRFPMTSLQRTPVQYDGLYHKSSYYCRLGVVEFPYSVVAGYFDGI